MSALENALALRYSGSNLRNRSRSAATHHASSGYVEIATSTSAASEALVTAGLTDALRQLMALAHAEDPDDRPSEWAASYVEGILRSTDRMLQQVYTEFPPAIAATGPNGGIRLLWSAEGRQIRMVVGGTEANKTYIYWEVGSLHGVHNAPILAESLAGFLLWMILGER